MSTVQKQGRIIWYRPYRKGFQIHRTNNTRIEKGVKKHILGRSKHYLML